MASVLTTSPPSRSARSSERSLLPAAVGPTTATTSPAGAWAAGEPPGPLASFVMMRSLTKRAGPAFPGSEGAPHGLHGQGQAAADQGRRPARRQDGEGHRAAQEGPGLPRRQERRLPQALTAVSSVAVRVRRGGDQRTRTPRRL